MKSLPLNRVLLLKIFGFLILFQTILFSENIYYVLDSNTTLVNSKVVNSSSANKDSEEVERVTLDSFGGTGVILMILFTSLLGLFFVRDEFNGVMD